MFCDIRDLEEGATLSADVVVVGSGIAGCEVATHLARNGTDLLLVESGREGFDPEIQALNDIHFSAKRHRRIDPDAAYHRYLPPALRGVSRVRQLLLPSGTDVPTLPPAPPPRHDVVYAGRIEPRKGIPTSSRRWRTCPAARSPSPAVRSRRRARLRSPRTRSASASA